MDFEATIRIYKGRHLEKAIPFDDEDVKVFIENVRNKGDVYRKLIPLLKKNCVIWTVEEVR